MANENVNLQTLYSEGKPFHANRFARRFINGDIWQFVSNTSKDKGSVLLSPDMRRTDKWTAQMGHEAAPRRIMVKFLVKNTIHFTLLRDKRSGKNRRSDTTFSMTYRSKKQMGAG